MKVKWCFRIFIFSFIMFSIFILLGCSNHDNSIKRNTENDSLKPNVTDRFLCDEDYEFQTVVDTKTGVTYLIWKENGGSKDGMGGITPLLNKNGYPVISEEVN